MPSTDQILALILKNEGGYTNHPADTGGETHYGISRTAHPEAWVDGTVSQEAARAIYLTQYVTYPKFDQIPDPYLMMQLVDFGVHSGPGLAIMKLALCDKTMFMTFTRFEWPFIKVGFN